MLTTTPRTSLLFQSAVDECNDKGAALQPLDYVWLHHAAQKCIGEDASTTALIESPIQVGNTTLYPLSIGASAWWQAKAQAWYDGDNNAEVLALAWAMAHSHNATAFEQAGTKTRADIALVAWQMSLSSSCTIAQLSYAVDRVLGQYDYVESNGDLIKVATPSSVDWGPQIARLCAAYHQPPHYYLWQLSVKAALEMLENIPGPNGEQSSRDESRRFAEFREVVKMIISKRTVKGAE